MRQYQRLMRRKGSTTHSDVEREQLLQLLRGAPGVEKAEVAGVHPKGGYHVVFEFANDRIDGFIGLLEANDWMSVM